MDCGQVGASSDEYDAMRRRFGGLVGRWRVTPSEAAALAGCGEGDLSRFLSGRLALSAMSETRVRLLLDLADALDRLLPLTTNAADWLRTDAADCGGEEPLGFLSGATAGIRAVRDGLASILAGDV